MPSVRVNHEYTPTELRTLIATAEDAEKLRMQGYVLQFNATTETYKVVHWTNASQPFRQDGNRAQRRQVQSTVGKEAFGELPPIIKRTPHQRVDSLMAKWMTEMQAAGGIPELVGDVPEGLTTKEREDLEKRRFLDSQAAEDKMKEIVGEAWKSGRTEITADIVRRVAASFLGVSDRGADG